MSKLSGVDEKTNIGMLAMEHFDQESKEFNIRQFVHDLEGDGYSVIWDDTIPVMYKPHKEV